MLDVSVRAHLLQTLVQKAVQKLVWTSANLLSACGPIPTTGAPAWTKVCNKQTQADTANHFPYACLPEQSCCSLKTIV